MSIVIVRTVPVINGFVQELPNLEPAKTYVPVEASDWTNLIEIGPHDPLRSNTFLKYEEEIVQ